ncbi:hypothetical protein [Natronoglycomyces albus]|uniref:Uncharacterized protein n=1 Tax=Natronoglycomyces albus TaxID=2811108 RepID=A0A895XK50_9ACTN|nr:hypothetical protein [Natronoglycomyces albus]QSB04192.1 hypothetical protein JQS30_10245 [Natronoglycomyces albus]
MQQSMLIQEQVEVSIIGECILINSQERIDHEITVSILLEIADEDRLFTYLLFYAPLDGDKSGKKREPYCRRGIRAVCDAIERELISIDLCVGYGNPDAETRDGYIRMREPADVQVEYVHAFLDDGDFENIGWDGDEGFDFGITEKGKRCLSLAHSLAQAEYELMLAEFGIVSARDLVLPAVQAWNKAHGFKAFTEDKNILMEYEEYFYHFIYGGLLNLDGVEVGYGPRNAIQWEVADPFRNAFNSDFAYKGPHAGLPLLGENVHFRIKEF